MSKDKSRRLSSPKVKKTISGTLLKILLPVTTLAIVFIIVFLSNTSEDNITDLAKGQLQQETSYNAQKMSQDITYMLGSADTYVNTISTVPFADPTSLQQYLATALDKWDLASGGGYVAFDDKSCVFANGYVPGDDFDPTSRGWYQSAGDSFACGTPYVDVQTGELCVTYSRKFTSADGRTAVMGIDVYLGALAEATGEISPLGTGIAMLITKDMVLAFPKNADFNGKLISEINDDYFNSIQSMVSSGKNDVISIKNGKSNYFSAYSNIPNTDWYLVAAVGEHDVLAKVDRFKIISFVLMVVTILAIALIILISINKIVTKPVKALSEQITEIAKGNFTVKIPKGKENEIGMIQDKMSGYVDVMRSTIGDIQNTSRQLSDEASNSHDASSKLHTQANEQSLSMEQIRSTMEGMAEAVTELATNATSLAQAVSDLTEEGRNTNETMHNLVDKAGKGQRDMLAVETNMTTISDAMTDMNEVVTKVDTSAKQITSIIELINSIAEQTNLLSLNASIEAARAGEAGKGFAVVASEIAKLANDSGNAAKEIANIITEITTEIAALSQKSQENMETIQESSTVVTTAGATFETIFNDLNKTGETMENMISMMTNIDDIASSVAAISEEQSASSQEVTATTDNLAESAHHVSEESEDVNRSAATVSDSAESIGDALSKFQI